MSSLADHIFQNLVGRWKITRYQNMSMIAEGSGDFLWSEEGLRFKESGYWLRGRTDHKTAPWNRQTYFQQTLYTFKKGRIVLSRPHPMFRLEEKEMHNPDSDKDSSLHYLYGIHQCKKDTYALSMVWKDEDHFTQHITVKGPRKNYALEIRFEKY